MFAGGWSLQDCLPELSDRLIFDGEGSLEDCRVRLVDRLMFDGDGFLDDFLRPSCGGECSSVLCILLEVVMLQLVVL